ncbi:MAG TPA: peptide chain release factor 3 [Candidatus Polarisedimenticolia bacterium]|nr:peptide chain release factor 3 [Candidatus Polarisedimenticolia bacterium]
MTQDPQLAQEVARRRTFAIISHPDAGKTTLTEKLLLYGGAIELAGSVTARRGRQRAASDWMALEQERGISITSSALQFEYRGHCLNLLDTPGHQDFSEDTYRTLMAADSAVMLLDAGKGVEEQTRKLFAVCRDRGLPITTWINKMDRPGRDPFELLDEVEEVMGLEAVPITWPIGSGDRFRGVFERDAGRVHLFERTVGGSQRAPVVVAHASQEGLADLLRAEDRDALMADMEVLEGALPAFDREAFLQGRMTPVFFGSAVTNFGVENFLDRFVELAPPPGPLVTSGGPIPPDADFFSGFVYKVQANMSKAHRDRVAFLRVSSGRFERGMSATHVRLDRVIRLSYPHRLFGQERSTIDAAYAGDVIGLINPGLFEIGDVVTSGPSFDIPHFPRFLPEHFAAARALDPSQRKGFLKGLAQLGEEGVVQIFRERSGSPTPLLGAVGWLQFEVFKYRMAAEYGVEIALDTTPYTRIRWVRQASQDNLKSFGHVVLDEAGRPAALFKNDWEIRYSEEKQPDVILSSVPLD